MAKHDVDVARCKACGEWGAMASIHTDAGPVERFVCMKCDRRKCERCDAIAKDGGERACASCGSVF